MRIKTNKIVSSKIVALTFGVLVICFAIAFYVVAWQEPTEAPPGDNVATPINVSDVGQIKTGNLVVNALGISAASGNALTINSGGNLCLGADCRSSWPAGGETDLRNIQVTPIDWDAIRICQAGTCCAPWRDCDGDGRTYMDKTDCNEGCSTCYVGSTTFTTSPDGKDQDCDGTIDEKIGGGEAYSKTCDFGLNVGKSSVENRCSSYCSSLGYIYNGISGCPPSPYFYDGYYHYSWLTATSWETCIEAWCYNNPPGTDTPYCLNTKDGTIFCGGLDTVTCNCIKPNRYQ